MQGFQRLFRVPLAQRVPAVCESRCLQSIVHPLRAQSQVVVKVPFGPDPASNPKNVRRRGPWIEQGKDVGDLAWRVRVDADFVQPEFHPAGTDVYGAEADDRHHDVESIFGARAVTQCSSLSTGWNRGLQSFCKAGLSYRIAFTRAMKSRTSIWGSSVQYCIGSVLVLP